jgi:hypothetical protein
MPSRRRRELDRPRIIVGVPVVARRTSPRVIVTAAADKRTRQASWRRTATTLASTATTLDAGPGTAFILDKGVLRI